MGLPRSKPGKSRLVTDPFDFLIPYGQRIETATGGVGYDFLRQSIANPLAWWTSARQMAKLFGTRIRVVASIMLISTTALAQQTSEEIASSPTKEIENTSTITAILTTPAFAGLTNAATVLGVSV